MMKGEKALVKYSSVTQLSPLRTATVILLLADK